MKVALLALGVLAKKQELATSVHDNMHQTLADECMIDDLSPSACALRLFFFDITNFSKT